MFIQSELFEADYYKGWLIITDRQTSKTYPVQLKSTETGRNITKSQFSSSIKTAGFDAACRTFKKIAITTPTVACY